MDPAPEPSDVPDTLSTLSNLGSDETSDASVAKDSKSAPKKRPVKVVKGARDFGPTEMSIREKAFKLVISVFESHGAVTIDTPVFELKETLADQYGEDSKLIYDLKDQGGEILSLRYDLTVPFARFIACNKIQNMKRYHISRVYRRDQPSVQRGRYREFYQCDFDIAGVYPLMVPDAEVVKVLVSLLDTLAGLSEFHYKRMGRFMVKMNHRQLLDSVFVICGVPKDKLRAISSAVDKLDKETWETVKKEMVVVKGLDESVADRIGEYVTISGEPFQVLEKLRKDPKIAGMKMATDTLNDMERLFRFLQAMGQDVISRLSFDLSLARGLDYYTGVIFEAILVGDEKSSLGSIGAGGRYDNLVGSFSGHQVPCVGCSLGIERVMTLMEQAEKDLAASQKKAIRSTKTMVYVASVGSNKDTEEMSLKMMMERMKLANEFWAMGIPTEFSYAEKPKMQKQLAQALEGGIPLVAIIGESELAKNVVQIKNLIMGKQIEVPREEVGNAARKMIEELGPQ